MADLSMVDLEAVVCSLEKGSSRLKKTAIVRGRGRNLAGPCPMCHGEDRFYLLPDAKDSTGARRGKWACRNCHPKEGDAIELLVHMDGLSYADAFIRLQEMFPALKSSSKRFEKKISAPVHQVRPLAENAVPPDSIWQERARKLLNAAIACLWSDIGSDARAYLFARGLTEDTIRAARLGYIPLAKNGQEGEEDAAIWGMNDDRETVQIPSGILFPYEYEGDLWKLRVRRIGDVPKDERYRIISGSSNGLYRADSVESGKPCMMFEGELDSLSVQQEAGCLVTCVATGSTSHARIFEWTVRLALADQVLLCFDNDEPEKTKDAFDYWTKRLVHARVYSLPGNYHDANDMLQKKGNIREWVASGIVEYEAIQASKQFVAAPIVVAPPVSEPAYVPVEPDRPVFDVAALRAEIGRMVREEEARWEYSTTELDPRWPPSAKVYKRLRLKEAQV